MTGPDPTVDPEGFERWAVRAVGGVPVAHPFDAGLDGVIATHDNSDGPGRVLVAVKGGDPSRLHPRMVRDLAHAADALDADGAVLIVRSAPPPAVHQAAARTNVSSPGTGGVPLVKILTVAEVLEGERPHGAEP